MTRLAYKARDEQGRPSRGEREAESASELRETLRTQGLFLVEARATSDGRGGRASTEELVLFTFHLQAVVSSGIPLLTGLNDLADQTSSRRFRVVVQDIRDSIQRGATLRQALARHPRVFSSSYLSMVEAGETSGRLDEILGRLVHLLEWTADLRAQVRQMLSYPAIVGTAMIGLVVLLLTFVLPRFSEVLESLNVELPWPTRLLLALSDGLRRFWPYLLAGAAAAAGGLSIVWRLPKPRERLDALLLRLPVVGGLQRAFAGSQISHFLGAFTEAGVPIAQGMTLLTGVVPNRHVARRVDLARNRVLSGSTLTQAFSEVSVLPPLVHRMLAIGEETGRLPEALQKADEFYDRELPRRVAQMMEAIGPAITVVLGATLLFVLASVLLPLYRAYSAISGGAQ